MERLRNCGYPTRPLFPGCGGRGGGGPGMGADTDILYLYGDPAYTLSYGIIGPLSRQKIYARQNAMNVEMSSARIVVEGEFSLVRSQFGYGDKKASQQTGISQLVHITLWQFSS